MRVPSSRKIPTNEHCSKLRSHVAWLEYQSIEWRLFKFTGPTTASRQHNQHFHRPWRMSQFHPANERREHFPDCVGRSWLNNCPTDSSGVTNPLDLCVLWKQSLARTVGKRLDESERSLYRHRFDCYCIERTNETMWSRFNTDLNHQCQKSRWAWSHLHVHNIIQRNHSRNQIRWWGNQEIGWRMSAIIPWECLRITNYQRIWTEVLPEIGYLVVHSTVFPLSTAQSSTAHIRDRCYRDDGILHSRTSSTNRKTALTTKKFIRSTVRCLSRSRTEPNRFWQVATISRRSSIVQ